VNAVPEVVAVVGQEDERPEAVGGEHLFALRQHVADSGGIAHARAGHDRNPLRGGEVEDRLRVGVGAGQRLVDVDRLAESGENFELFAVLRTVDALEEIGVEPGKVLQRFDDLHAVFAAHLGGEFADPLAAQRKCSAAAGERLRNTRPRNAELIAGQVEAVAEADHVRGVQPDDADLQFTIHLITPLFVGGQRVLPVRLFHDQNLAADFRKLDLALPAVAQHII